MKQDYSFLPTNLEVINSISDQNNLRELKGQWDYLSFLSYPDIIMKDEQTNLDAAKLTNRTGGIKYINQGGGYEYYIAFYSHSVTAISAHTKRFWVKIKWLNQGGGIEKTEDISDHVECRDSERRSTWTFSLTKEQVDAVKKGTADIFGNIDFKKCL